MYYIYFNGSGDKYISKSMNQLSEKIGLTPDHISKMLKSSAMYKTQKYIILKFEESDVLKQPARNRKGNIKSLIGSMKKTIERHKNDQNHTQNGIYYGGQEDW